MFYLCKVFHPVYHSLFKIRMIVSRKNLNLKVNEKMEITIIKVVLAVIFASAVIGKLTGKTKSTFENAGFSPAVMYATAMVFPFSGLIG